VSLLAFGLGNPATAQNLNALSYTVIVLPTVNSATTATATTATTTWKTKKKDKDRYDSAWTEIPMHSDQKSGRILPKVTEDTIKVAIASGLAASRTTVSATRLKLFAQIFASVLAARTLMSGRAAR